MINLLPEDYQEGVRRRYRARRLVLAGLLAATWCLMAALMAGALWWVARGERQTLAESVEGLKRQVATEQLAVDERRLALFAKQVDLLALQSGASAILSVLWSDLAAARPAGVTISDWRYRLTAEGKVLELAGRTTERQALLDFIDRLKSDARFAAVESPLSNLVRSGQSQFSLSLLLASDHER